MNEDKSTISNNAATESGQRILGLSITDATLYLAVLTALAYMWAYFRELGNKNFYNLPDYFIEMNTSTVVKAFGETWSYIAVIVFIFWVFNLFINAKKFWGIAISILSFYVVLEGLFVDTTLKNLLYWLIASLLGIQIFKNQIAKKLYIALLVVLFMGYSYLIGNFQGKIETEYIVIDQPRVVSNDTSRNQLPFIVLDSYGQYFIVAPYDDKSKEIIPHFELIEQKYVAQKPFLMKYKKLGRLTVRED